MRPLADLLNQRVRISGVIQEWNDRGVLLINVRIWPYQAADLSSPRLVDHIWLWLPSIKETFSGLEERWGEKVERFRGVSAIGDIIKYRRGNGTEDYGVRMPIAERTAALGPFSLECLDGMWVNEKALKEIETLKQAIDTNNLILPSHLTYQKLKGWIYEAHEFIVRSHQATVDRLASQKHYPVGKDPKIKGKKRERAMGFS